MKTIFIFIDGLGLGEDDKAKNPVAAANTPGIDFISRNFRVICTDAALGISGLPQSATGQTAIFTGINAAEVLGRHMSGKPTETLVNLINRTNLFKELIDRGFSVTYANVYRDEYFKEMTNPSNKRNRPSVTTVMGLSVGMRFRGVGDYREGNGVYHDITGQIMIESGYDVERITPREAARRIYSISRNYDFTLYEHFMTDIIGHTGDMEKAIAAVELLDSFLEALVEFVDPKEYVIVIASDHGNIEDISVRTHTFNKVPTFFIGNLPDDLDIKVEAITDIMPAVIKIMDVNGENRKDQNIN